jgi:hypothetical protein
VSLLLLLVSETAVKVNVKFRFRNSAHIGTPLYGVPQYRPMELEDNERAIACIVVLIRVICATSTFVRSK